MAIIISIVNQKGGAGKTTTAINLAAALTEKKRAVLLVDADHQSASTSAILAPDEEHCALSAALNGDEIKTIKIGKYDLLVSTLTLGETANSLSAIKTPSIKNKKLKTTLEPIKDKYDYIIIDCPPNYNVITYNALWASDYCLIPMLPNDLHYIALEDMLDIIISVQEQGAKVVPLGILMVQYDKRLKLHNILNDKVEDEHPGLLFWSKIRNNVDVAEQATVSLDIFAYNPSCNGAKDYMDAANELERKIKASK